MTPTIKFRRPAGGRNAPAESGQLLARLGLPSGSCLCAQREALIHEFGEERRSRRIARAIVRPRPTRTTAHLAEVTSVAVRSVIKEFVRALVSNAASCCYPQGAANESRNGNALHVPVLGFAFHGRQEFCLLSALLSSSTAVPSPQICVKASDGASAVRRLNLPSFDNRKAQRRGATSCSGISAERVYGRRRGSQRKGPGLPFAQLTSLPEERLARRGRGVSPRLVGGGSFRLRSAGLGDRAASRSAAAENPAAGAATTGARGVLHVPLLRGRAADRRSDRRPPRRAVARIGDRVPGLARRRRLAASLARSLSPRARSLRAGTARADRAAALDRTTQAHVEGQKAAATPGGRQ